MIQSVEAVGTPGDGEVGETRAILDPHEQQRLAFEPDGGGIEHGVDGVRPVGRGEDRIPVVALEEVGGGQVVALNIRSVL